MQKTQEKEARGIEIGFIYSFFYEQGVTLAMWVQDPRNRNFAEFYPEVLKLFQIGVSFWGLGLVAAFVKNLLL